MCEREDIVLLSNEPVSADLLKRAVAYFSFLFIITSDWHSCLAVKVLDVVGMQVLSAAHYIPIAPPPWRTHP